MSTLYYLAFGSNLHPLRLGERVPSARQVGRPLLPGYRLAFHKLGQDGSGKGDLVWTGESADYALGALFAVDAAEKPDLDAAEGEGYRADAMNVTVDGHVYEAFVYIGEQPYIDSDLHPYRWYRDIVWQGAHFQGAPQDYLDAIAAVPAVVDPDPERRERNQSLLQRIRQSA